MGVYDKWDQHHIETEEDLTKMASYFTKDQPVIGGFDTETTGLHIIYDKPFLYQFGWLYRNKPHGRVYTFYPTPRNMEIFLKLTKMLKIFVGHNIKYDLHMTYNIGYGQDVLNMTNLAENMVAARLALEAIPSRDGGDSLQLKKLGEKYISSEASRSESLIKDELEKLNAERVQVLTAVLKQFDHPEEQSYKPIRKDTGKATTKSYAEKNPENVVWGLIPKKWNKGLIEKFLKDPTHDVEDLPEDVREAYLNWQEEYPPPTYEDIDRELMIKYGGEDVITMLEFFSMCLPFIKKREQSRIFKQESQVILPLLEMERVGLKADRVYLEKSRLKVKDYIKRLRFEMHELAGEAVNVGQHERIKQIYQEKWGITLEKADKKVIKDIIAEKQGKPKRFAQLIKALRSLEKWYSTYIVRILETSKHDGRAYTQLHQNSAVSGRMSSDFQQFPKDALKDEDGNELYHPRKPFLVDSQIVYIDYSQVELRAQADYTIKVSGGDLNLCRAYMPFKCTHYKSGEPYNFKEISGRRRWDEMKAGFSWNKVKSEKGTPTLEDAFNQDWSVWTVPETGEPWKPTDVHGATTHNALTLLGYECIEKYAQYRYTGNGDPFFDREIGPKDYKLIRGKGKTFNFMKNYGGGLGAAMNQLNLSREVSQALIDGYAEAFPQVVTYQEKVVLRHNRNGYVQNAYGRRYYIKDRNKAYKLANYLIQGSCADALKRAIILLYKYIKENKLKSRMIIPIHDEVQFEVVPGEEKHIVELKLIMEEVFEDWCLIPIVADLEISRTNWYEKEDISLEEAITL